MRLVLPAFDLPARSHPSVTSHYDYGSQAIFC